MKDDFLNLSETQLEYLKLDPLEAICTIFHKTKQSLNDKIIYNNCLKLASSAFVYNIAYIYSYCYCDGVVPIPFLRKIIENLNSKNFQTIEEAYNYLCNKIEQLGYTTIKISSKYSKLTDNEKKELSEIIDNYISDHVRS